MLLLIIIAFYNFVSLVNESKVTPTFVEVIKDFPVPNKNLRKWDAPIVSDLDQDGYSDLILNDHGLGVSICWNNKGKFEKPFDLIMGDLHGISVGDFDNDQSLEIIISRGGGSGSNARNSKIFKVNKNRTFSEVPNFKDPLALMRGRTVKFMDGDHDGDLDLLNFAFPDKQKDGKSENYIYENNGQGQLVLKETLPFTKMNGQKTLLTDFNNDHTLDLILYGDGNIRAYRGEGDLKYKDETKNIFPFTINDVTSIIEFDYDNDGDFDLYFTRGKEFVKGETFFDKEKKRLGFFTKRASFNFDKIKTGDVLQFENYHTQWPQTNQLFIGETAYKYEHPGETHSGKDIRLVNSDALGFPDRLPDKGIYIGFVGNENWRIEGEVGGPLTGVIHGVLDYPKMEHDLGLHDILLENKNGTFIEVTQSAKIYFNEHTTGSTAADINNDGWQDVIIIKRGNLIHENQVIVYLNTGDKQFKRVEDHGMISNELGAIGMGVASLDYNLDGKLDIIIGNERGKWHLFKNTTTNSSNHLNINVNQLDINQQSLLGATVEVQYCGKTQVQRVGSTSAAYSTSFDPNLTFGLGSCTDKVKLNITLTNGKVFKKQLMINK